VNLESKVPPETGLVQAYEQILKEIGRKGYQVESDDNFHGTAARAASALEDMVWPVALIRTSIDEILSKTFQARYDQMVLSKHNVCFGVCPHHLLPVIYRASLAYIPRERVLGISKLSRLTQLLARRPVLQEQLTDDLAGILYERLETEGSAVYVQGLHMCMASRGVEAHEVRIVTSAVRGCFKDDPATRTEFLDLVRTGHPELI
jgi:GTP cyclohydrolase I